MLVGADAERSCSRRRSVTDAACPSRVLIGPLLQFCIALSFLNVGADDSVRPPKAPSASEEACCIPFPPGRRKLHIRSLLLPFQTGTISLGSGLADKWGLSPKATGGVSIFQEKKEGRAKPELQTVPPSRQKKPAPFRFRRGGENSISAAFFFLPKL